MKSWILPLHLLVVLAHVVGPDGTEEPDVVVGVELGHLLLSGFMRSVDFHFPVQSIVQQKVVCHPNSVGLHGVTLAIVVVADIAWKMILWFSFSVLARKI